MKLNLYTNVLNFIHGEDEGGIMWNDPDIAVEWPLDGIDEITLSDKDKKWKTLKESQIRYQVHYYDKNINYWWGRVYWK